MIFGGRSNQGDINEAVLLDFKNEQITIMGHIGQKRCLHKCYRPKSNYNDHVLIFGGDDINSIECYSMKKNKIDNELSM